MTNNSNTDGETAAALSIAKLKNLYANVKLKETTIKDLKAGLKDAQDACSVALATLLKYLERCYGNGDTFSPEQWITTGKRTRDLIREKKVADNALKELQDLIEEEKTMKTQSMYKMSLGESALKKAAVVSVSTLEEVDYIWQRKLKCRRIELVRGNDPGEIVAIREFCGSHPMEIHDADAEEVADP